MNIRIRALPGVAALALACLNLSALPGSAIAADELTGAAAAQRPGPANTAIPAGTPLALPARQGQQATPATQAVPVKQAIPVTAPGKQAPVIRTTVAAPTLGNTRTVAVGNGKTDLQVGPIQLDAPDRNDLRLKLAIPADSGDATASAGMAGSTAAAGSQQPAAGTGYVQTGSGTGGVPQLQGHVAGRDCPHCAGHAGEAVSDTDRALAVQQDAEHQASRLLGQPARSRVNTYAVTRSGADELAAQNAAIARMRGGQPVQGLSVRNWALWELKYGNRALQKPPVRPAGAAVQAEAVADGDSGASVFDPCNPPPPILPNPEFLHLDEQRQDLLGKARAIAAQDTRSPELARLERDIQKIEEQLRWKDAFLDPCDRETTRAWNEAARAALHLPDDLPSNPDTRSALRAIDEFAANVRTRTGLGLRQPGQSYYEDYIDGQRDWHSLPEREKQQWADAEERLLNNQDDRSLTDWRNRANAEADREREAARAARQAAFNARVEAEQAEMRKAEAAAAARRKAEEQREQALERRDALDAEARALNQELRSAIATGDQVRQRDIEARLDAISEYMMAEGMPDAQERAAISSADTRRMADLAARRAAAEKQAAADARQAAIDRKRDLEQQNRNVLTRGSNMAAGFGIAGGKAAVEIVQMGLDGVSTGMRAADIGNPGPNRSTIGKLFEDSKSVGEFAGTIWKGCVEMVKGVGTHLMEGDARAFGGDLFNFGSMAVPVKAVPKGSLPVAKGVAEAAAAAPGTAARVANRLDIETFRRLSPAEQARALAGQSEPVRSGLLGQLNKAERAAFTEADGALQLGQAPQGLFDCPGDGFVYLTREGERVIVGDAFVGLSRFEDFIPHGTHAARMTAAEIEALIAKAPPYTRAELLAKIDLVYAGRIPRLVMDSDTARAMYQVMVEHFRHANGRLPSPAELAPLIRALDTTTPGSAAPSVAAAVEAPFGYGPTGTIASKPLPQGTVPEWLKAQGVGAEALPPELLQPPKLHQPADAPRPDISSRGTVRND